MKIGFFDSGIGGLTVLADAATLYNDCEFIYFGDVIHAPYGTKDREQVLCLTLDAVETLAKENLDALVVACNTATSVAVRALREKYSFPIIGMEPALKPALSASEGNILVLATELTLRESKFKYLVDTFNATDRVLKLPMGNLVKFAEAGDFDSPQLVEYIKKQLSTIDLKNIDSVVLGCTHFLYFRNIIEKLLPGHIRIFDGNLGTIRHTAKLTGVDMRATSADPDFGRIKFYMSGLLLDDHCLKYHQFIDSINNYLGGRKNG